MADYIALQIGAKLPWKHEPGSPEAASEGCTCSQARNKFGKGSTKQGEHRWYADPFCPVHGPTAAKRTGKPKDIKVTTQVIRTRKRRSKAR